MGVGLPSLQGSSDGEAFILETLNEGSGREVVRVRAHRHRDHGPHADEAVEQQRHEHDAQHANDDERHDHRDQLIATTCGRILEQDAELNPTEDRVGQARRVHEADDQVDVAVRDLRLHIRVAERDRISGLEDEPKDDGVSTRVRVAREAR